MGGFYTPLVLTSVRCEGEHTAGNLITTRYYLITQDQRKSALNKPRLHVPTGFFHIEKQQINKQLTSKSVTQHGVLCH